jgi:hypothetical protein
MTPENAAGHPAQPAGLTPENKELLAKYAGHLERSPLTGHSPRAYLGAIRQPVASGVPSAGPVSGGRSAPQLGRRAAASGLLVMSRA